MALKDLLSKMYDANTKNDFDGELSLKERIKLDREQYVKNQNREFIYNMPIGAGNCDILVISNLFFGDQFSPVRIEKLTAHIEEICKNPNGRIVLGGNIFYFPQGTFPTKYLGVGRQTFVDRCQKDVLNYFSKLIPKDRILCAYSGVSERRCCKATGFNPLQKMMSEWGCDHLYAGDACKLELILNSNRTNNLNKSAILYFGQSELSTNSYAVTERKTRSLASNCPEADVIVDSLSARAFCAYTIKTMNSSDYNLSKTIISPLYLFSPAGYRDEYSENLKNRPHLQSTTDNYFIRVEIEPLQDEFKRLNEKSSLVQTEYVVTASYKNFGRSVQEDYNFDLIKSINDIMVENETYQQMIIDYAKEICFNKTTEGINNEIEKDQIKEEKDLIDAFFERGNKGKNNEGM